MDLKRAWRNGFLVSLIFALPLSDLYYYEHGNLIASGNTLKKTAHQTENCAAGTACSSLQTGNSSPSEKSNGESDADGNRILITTETWTSVSLETNAAESGNMRDAALHFSPEYILQCVDLTCEGNPDIPEDIKQVIDINTDIGSIASLTFGFGDSTASAPRHSGPFAPVMFGGGSPGSASGLQSDLEDVTESPFAGRSPEPSGQTETAESNDTPNVHSGIDNDLLHSVPEPSSLVMMTIGTISVASFFHWRRTKRSASPS